MPTPGCPERRGRLAQAPRACRGVGNPTVVSSSSSARGPPHRLGGPLPGRRRWQVTAEELSGLAIPRLLFEPPFGSDEDASAAADFTRELADLVAAGRSGDAVERFHLGIGVPPEVIAQMAPQTRSALEAVAHTLVYDCVISDATSFELKTLEVFSLAAAPIERDGVDPLETDLARRTVR